MEQKEYAIDAKESGSEYEQCFVGEYLQGAQVALSACLAVMLVAVSANLRLESGAMNVVVTATLSANPPLRLTLPVALSPGCFPVKSLHFGLDLFPRLLVGKHRETPASAFALDN